MKERLKLLARLGLVFFLFFILQKCLFMGYNHWFAQGYTWSDALQVFYHGFTLDAATVCYLLLLPWAITCISIGFKHFPIRKITFPYYLLISLLLATIAIVDSSLYPFWGFKLDASIFLYLDSPRNAAASVSAGFMIGHILMILAATGALAYLLTRLTPVYWQTEWKRKQRIRAAVVLSALSFPLFVTIRGGFGESTTNIGQAYFSNKDFLNHSSVNPAFSLLASIGKTANYADSYNYLDEPTRRSLFDGLYPTSDTDTPALLNTRRPDILIILMESFGATMVHNLGGLPDVAPNLERLSHEGVYFTRCYANSFRTDRGTVCTFSGYQSFPDLSVMKIPSKSRTLPSIASQLRKEGYSTSFLYGGDINFTNMKSYLHESGYEELKSNTDYPLLKRKNPWGVNDDITFDDLYQMLQHRRSPWFQSFLTLSSHEPFEVPYKRLKDQIPNAFAFTDHCLGQFVDRMKKTRQWKNLLIICLPDHGFHYPKTGSPNRPEIHHMPMLWIGGAIKRPMVIDKLMNQTDMAATLLGQLGLPHTDFTFSRNVLSKQYTYPFAYYTFNNGFAFIDSTGYTVFDNHACKAVDEQPSPNRRRTDIGKAILQTSYDDLGAR